MGRRADPTGLKAQLNAREILYLGTNVTAGVPLAAWATNQIWAKAHPGLVRGFQLAIREAGAYAKAHKGTIRNAIPEYTSLKAADVAALHLEGYPATTEAKAIKRVADYMKATGALTTTFHVQNMIWPQPKKYVPLPGSGCWASRAGARCPASRRWWVASPTHFVTRSSVNPKGDAKT